MENNSSILKISWSRFCLNCMVMGFAGLIFGVVLVIHKNYLGLILIIIGLSSFFIKNGVVLNLEERKIKQSYSVFNLFIGLWTRLPLVEGIHIVKAKDIVEDDDIGYSISPKSLTEGLYKVYLISSSEFNILVFEGKKGKEAESIGKVLAKKFNVEITKLGY